MSDAGKQISVDPLTDTVGQHQSAVEPDSAANGSTVVSAFQIGRSTTGAASAIGWATSSDGGRTWRNGTLPGVTSNQSKPGPFVRVSDPVVAYDRVHRAWIVSMLALAKAGPSGVSSSILTSRSADGLQWEAPVVVKKAEQDTGQDKDWISCDNGHGSRRAGHCYVVWTIPGFKADRLAVVESSNGGRTWSPQRDFPIDGFAFVPLIRPNGAVTLVYRRSHARILEARTSVDGLRRFSRPARIATFRAKTVPAVRVDVFPSAEIAADGREYVLWQDCRFRPGCGVNSLVISTSATGARWTRPRLVQTGAALTRLEHILPTVAIDASTRGTRTRLAVMFYYLSPSGCVRDSCTTTAYLMFSGNGGRSWSQPLNLAGPLPLTWFPSTFGTRFLGDYMAMSFVPGGTAVPLYAAATAPSGGQFHQGIFAAPTRAK
ncbi:MAG: hypothetical protein QOE13_1285 [Gaiellaceae bacterium]|nr:hypothetical protein [Gaiellaceae bacterium]